MVLSSEASLACHIDANPKHGAPLHGAPVAQNLFKRRVDRANRAPAIEQLLERLAEFLFDLERRLKLPRSRFDVPRFYDHAKCIEEQRERITQTRASGAEIIKVRVVVLLVRQCEQPCARERCCGHQPPRRAAARRGAQAQSSTSSPAAAREIQRSCEVSLHERKR